MKRPPPNHLTPEDILTAPKGPPLELELICRQCGHKAKHKFEYVMFNPKIKPQRNDDWDGVFLPRIIECERCDAVDDYRLGVLSYMRLTAEILEMASSDESGLGAQGGGRVITGVSQLWDGTVVRRPSQAIAHLRELTERHPESGEAWRRLGNAQERFGRPSQAEISWRKALEVDPGELESAYSLAKCLGERGQWPEAFGFLRKGIELLPDSRDIDQGHRLDLSQSLVGLLDWTLDITDEPIALMATWSSGVVNEKAFVTVSSVNLRRVKNWDRLAELLVSEDMIAANLTAELPEDEPTILERRLTGNWTEPPDIESLPPTLVVKPRPRVGRNAPCPCGSGKKYKKCCGP
jgi:hypothetical protein